MNEPTERIDRGTWWHEPGDAAMSGDVLKGLPMGDYRIYAERIIDASLAERMSDHWGEWWKWNVSSDEDRHFRMEALIKFFGLVERSKLPDPVDVPEWVQRWLDDTAGLIEHGKVWALKAWIGDALIAGAVRVETPDVPDDVKEAATFVFFNGWGAGSVENVDTIVRWVREQVGDSDG